MRAAIMQPTYLPWMGYFDLIDRSDVFIFLDDVELSKPSWQQRNKILGPDGPFWLTVPVQGSSHTLIRDATIDDSKGWRDSHLKSIEYNYRNAAFYDDHDGWIEETYATPWEKLAELNTTIVEGLTDRIGIDVDFHIASTLEAEDDRVGRLIQLCHAVGADRYLSPVGSHDYLEEGLFEEEGLQLAYQNFHHPEYEQVFGDAFTSHLSVVDLLLNVGPDSLDRIRDGQRELLTHADVDERQMKETKAPIEGSREGKRP